MPKRPWATLNGLIAGIIQTSIVDNRVIFDALTAAPSRCLRQPRSLGGLFSFPACFASGLFLAEQQAMTEEIEGEGMPVPDALLPGLGHKDAAAGPRVQYAALPYRLDKGGRIEVLLITSRTTRRWILPKGWPMGQRPPHKVAAQEAYEEAGIEGRAAKTPIGAYTYNKLLPNGSSTPCRAEVFALKVEKQKSTWPERKQRKRRWLTLEEAADLISDRELAPLIRAFVPAAS